MRQPLHDPPQRPPSSPFALGSFFSFCRPFCPSARKFGERIFMRCAALAVFSLLQSATDLFSAGNGQKKNNDSQLLGDSALQKQYISGLNWKPGPGDLLFIGRRRSGLQSCSNKYIDITGCGSGDAVKKKKKFRVCAFLCERFCRGAA
jgi:hypothetical protein